MDAAEYSLYSSQLEAFSRACTQAIPSSRGGHAQLLAKLRAVPDMSGLQPSATRDHYTPRPARILDAAGGVVAPSYTDWAREQLQAHGGNARAVWASFHAREWALSWWHQEMLYFWLQRGAHPWDGIQLQVRCEQENGGERPFPMEEWRAPQDEHELVNPPAPSATGSPLGPARYTLVAAVDMERFYRLGQRLRGENMDRAAGRSVTVMRGDGSPAYTSTLGREAPEAFRQPWRVQRWFEDWAFSSAGRSGAIAGHHWAFQLSDWDPGNPSIGRQLDFVPLWTHRRKIARVNSQRLTDLELYAQLLRLVERTGGVPFGWYFYLLHGNLVRDGAGERVLAASEWGVIDLPEHDHRVLKAWGQTPYGF